MRKRLISPMPHGRLPFDGVGLDLANLATVEITSEDEAHPIECALQLGGTRGWCAAEPGPQVIRLLFDQPQKLKRIWLDFEETETQRTQEFALRWSPDRGRSFREIVRQQWNFNPPTPQEVKPPRLAVNHPRLGFGLSGHLLMLSAILPASGTQLTILLTLAIEGAGRDRLGPSVFLNPFPY